MTVQLDIFAGPIQGRQLTFDKYARISVGRSPEAFLSIPDDKKMSRLHCLIEILPPSQIFIKDLQSTNGTFLGHSDLQGESPSYSRIVESHLQRGDVIKVGNTEVRVSWPQEDQDVRYCSHCRSPLPPSRKSMSPVEENPLCFHCREEDEMPPGTKIGAFEIIRKLGQGGMGKVYLMRHSQSNQLLAIKIAAPNVLPSQEQIQRFLREASCGVSIRHPGLVRYYPPGYIDGKFFYVPMEYMPGGDLQAYLKQAGRPLSLAQTRQLIGQLLEGIGFLHDHKIVHRDIKPSNLLLPEAPSPTTPLLVKLGDFGLAKPYEDAGLSGLTLSHQYLGTLEFMAPEQGENARSVGPLADIYSAAATIYYLLTLREIFGDVHGHALIAKILNEEPIPLREVHPHLPAPFTEVIMQCLKKEPQERCQTIREFQERLERAFPA